MNKTTFQRECTACVHSFLQDNYKIVLQSGAFIKLRHRVNGNIVTMSLFGDVLIIRKNGYVIKTIPNETMH